MKRNLRILSLAAFLLGTQVMQAQTGRYFEEVFTAVSKQSNITYGTNFYFTPPITVDPMNPQQGPLPMDVYTPTGDAETGRPLVIYLHTGNFLPQYFNGSPTGSRNDSSNVEICNRFAKRGFVAASISYRLGWDPLNSSADVRRGTLLNAVYRALHDAKTAVRYFKKSVAEDGNPYGIDTNRIALFGQGSGGYIALAYNTLDRIEELQIEKFVDVNGNLIGSEENGYLYPIPVDNPSWDPRFMFATDSTTQKIMLGFDFDRLFDESTMYLISPEEAGINFTTLKGLIDVVLTPSLDTINDVTVKAEFNYGTALNKIQFKGALVADFLAYNNTTMLSVALASALEGPDGTYLLTFSVAQTLGDSITISVNKAGFIGEVTYTI